MYLVSNFFLEIDYNIGADPFDDQISGYSDISFPINDSYGSSTSVQHVADAFLLDIRNYGIRFDFTSIQPAIQEIL